MSAKGYWKWRVQQKTPHTFRAQWRVWWWPIWRSIGVQGYGWRGFPTAADAISAVRDELHYKERSYYFRKAKWSVVEEGSWPE